MLESTEDRFEFAESVEPSMLASLSREQKARVSAILDDYLRALEQGVPPAREALLAAHPDLAEVLDAYLESLVGLHDVAAAFGGEVSAGQTVASPDEKRLGDFVLLGEIGRGGMGVVYEARQLSLGRRVALKVLPFAAVLDQRQIARFKNEAQAAAQLAHPNIVPVYAVGVERGVHYFAMQYIEGQPLDRAIAQLRRQAGLAANAADESTVALSAGGTHAKVSTASSQASESLLSAKWPGGREYFESVMRLGIQAAEALHAAHSFGVVHRDVKPSNLLLDASGKLWVTDFGLARVQADAGLTQTGDIVGTRQYMSPEQAAGEAALVDQRTDIYSLGATLYELLTLRPAFGRQDLAAGALAARSEPPRIRSLRPEVPFDLETVVGKALAQQRDERYLTAQELADDLKRLLAGQSPIARRPSLVDRTAKWARQHRHAVAWGTLAAAAAFVALTVAMIVVGRARMRAEHDFARAERYLKQAQDTVYQLGSLSAEQLADVPGAENVRREMLAGTLAYYQQFVAQAEDSPELRSELATTYAKIGSLHDQMGEAGAAIESHQQAVRLLTELAREQPRAANMPSQLAAARNNLALALGHAGRGADARQELARAIELQQRLVEAEPQATQYLAELALSHNNLGSQWRAAGEERLAAEEFREAMRLGELAAARQRDELGVARNLAAACNNLAALEASKSPSEAIRLYQRAADLQRRLVRSQAGELKYQRELATTLNNLAAAQARGNDLAAAVSTYGEAIEIEKHVLRVAPLDRTFRHDLAVTYNNLGLAHARLKEPDDAERCFRNALGFQQQLVAEQPGDAELNSSLGGIANNLGIVRQGWGKHREAADSFALAVEHQKRAVEGHPDEVRYRTLLAKHYDHYGRALAALGRTEEALAISKLADGMENQE